MATYTLVAHHGSPGTPDDFKGIKESFSEHEFLTPTRKGYPQHNSNLPHNDKIIVVGYSFGTLQALKDACEYGTKVKKIILISPFLFGGRKLGTVAKTLIQAPLLGNYILNKSALKAIPQMLENSSSPQKVSEEYLAHGEKFKSSAILRPALLEKDFCACCIPNLLQELAAKKIPVVIIRGEKDKTSTYESQIAPLKKEISIEEHIIPEGGHALLWTHKNEVVNLMKNEINKLESAESVSPKTSNQLMPSAERPYGYFEGEHEQNNVYAFLKHHLEVHPKRPILSWVDMAEIAKWHKNGMKGDLPHKQVNARDLDLCVDRIAHGFKKLGIGKGDRVIIFVPMSFLMYASMFALQKIGAVAVFLESWARRDQFSLILETAAPKALISVEQAFDFIAQMPEVDKIIPIKICAGPAKKRYNAHIEEYLAMDKTKGYLHYAIEKIKFVLARNERYVKPEPVEREHTALITFTTGSTGTPKGADRTHRFLAAQHYALNRHLPYNEKDIDLPVFPVFSLNNMAAGVTTVIPALNLAQLTETDAAVLYHQLIKQKVTCATLSPSLFRAISAYCLEKNYKLNLRRIITGGAPVSRDDVKQMKEVAPDAEILVLYGSTEVEPMAHIEGNEFINLKTRAMEDAEWVDDGVNVGHFDKGLKVRYLKIHPDPIIIKSADDWKDLVVENGKVGEIIVAGEHVCQGYYNNEEAFSRAKIKDENGVIWHRTGDLGRMDEKGDLWLVGRINNAIDRAGEYVFPVRAEIILKKLPFVEKAAYLGLPDSKLGEKTACVVSTKDNLRDPSYELEIRRLFNKNGVPVDEVIFMETIPLDPRHHSKVEYALLKKQILEMK